MMKKVCVSEFLLICVFIVVDEEIKIAEYQDQWIRFYGILLESITDIVIKDATVCVGEPWRTFQMVRFILNSHLNYLFLFVWLGKCIRESLKI